MKRIVVVAALLCLVGCSEPTPDYPTLEGDWRFEVVRVRGCEYVVYHSGYRGGLTHAGDCANPAHKARP